LFGRAAPHFRFFILPSPFSSPGGEIESRLAYTQKSEGQNLSGRPAFAKPDFGSLCV